MPANSRWDLIRRLRVKWLEHNIQLWLSIRLILGRQKLRTGIWYVFAFIFEFMSYPAVD